MGARSTSERLRAGLATALAALALLVVLPLPAFGQGDPIIGFEPGDPEMNAAITEARKTVDRVIGYLEAEDALAKVLVLKVAIPTPAGGHEHIYLDQIERQGPERFEGALANNPVDLPDMSFGDRYAFDHAQITDWLIDDGQLIHGAYTLRVMLPRMSREEAEQLEGQLAPLP